MALIEFRVVVEAHPGCCDEVTIYRRGKVSMELFNCPTKETGEKIGKRISTEVNKERE